MNILINNIQMGKSDYGTCMSRNVLVQALELYFCQEVEMTLIFMIYVYI